MLELHHLLAPTDFSEHSTTALRHACGFAEKFGATLHLLHILPEIVPIGPDPTLAAVMPPEYYTQTEEQAKQALSKILDPTWGRPAKVEYHLRWGDAVEGILSHAASHPTDMIILATHGRTGLSHMLLGSVAERIVREAPCPVLTVRSKT